VLLVSVTGDPFVPTALDTQPWTLSPGRVPASVRHSVIVDDEPLGHELRALRLDELLQVS
jgi:hypothetical protein|tara:strand:+ start:914 stop:1093 length:180 start_codon:yes stop_codon:yes gene_type:complete